MSTSAFKFVGFEESELIIVLQKFIYSLKKKIKSTTLRYLLSWWLFQEKKNKKKNKKKKKKKKKKKNKNLKKKEKEKIN